MAWKGTWLPNRSTDILGDRPEMFWDFVFLEERRGAAYPAGECYEDRSAIEIRCRSGIETTQTTMQDVLPVPSRRKSDDSYRILMMTSSSRGTSIGRLTHAGSDGAVQDPRPAIEGRKVTWPL